MTTSVSETPPPRTVQGARARGVILPGLLALLVLVSAALLWAGAQPSAGLALVAAAAALGLAFLAVRRRSETAAVPERRAEPGASGPRLRQTSAMLDLGAFMARRPDGTIISWSAGCERLYGWRAEEAMGRISHELLGTVFPKPLAEIEAELERDGEWTGLLRQRNRLGAEVTVAVHKGLQRDAAGGPEAIVESLVDVSGEQRAEAQFRSILETVPDAMIVIDERGVMTSFSRAAEQLFGWTAAEAIGRNVSILMPNPDRARHDTYLERYLATGERHIIGVGREVTGQRRNGTTFPMELSVGEVNTGGHRLFTGFVRDLSERQEHQQRLQSVQAELLHVSRLSAAGEMASALAHELNQPLTAIASSVRAALRMLQDQPEGTLPPRAAEAMERAAAQSLRAGQIVRRLREFVLKGDVDRQLMELTPLVEEAAALALVGARQAGVHVTFRLDPVPISVVVDRIQIQQVLLNLIRNAIDAMTETPDEGARREMVISTSWPDASSIEVAVADTGPGLAPEVAAKLFEPFVTTKAAGMGVGLSISRTIIETHGGRLWAQPNPVGGTIFRFTLPAGAAISGDQVS